MDGEERQTLTRRYRGVSWHAGRRKWQAALRVRDRKMTYLGAFEAIEDAARAYNDAAVLAFGRDAEINVITAVKDPAPPKPKEISRLCKEIRQGWTEEDYRKRAPHWAHVSSFVRRCDGSSPAMGG